MVIGRKLQVTLSAKRPAIVENKFGILTDNFILKLCLAIWSLTKMIFQTRDNIMISLFHNVNLGA